MVTIKLTTMERVERSGMRHKKDNVSNLKYMSLFYISAKRNILMSCIRTGNIFLALEQRRLADGTD